MKGFVRKNQLLSLCGLNCGLCPMFIGKYCGGCGNGNQSCGIARCSLEQGKIEYCYECEKYPCDRYLHIDEYDSFITHRRQKLDLERARNIGIEAYNLEQEEKARMSICWSCRSCGKPCCRLKKRQTWMNCRIRRKAGTPQMYWKG